MPILETVKKYKKEVIGITLFMIAMPITEILIKIIFTYGTYIGTFIRSIGEGGACF